MFTFWRILDFFSQLQVQGKLSTYKKSSTLIFLLIKIKPKNSQIVFFFGFYDKRQYFHRKPETGCE